MLYHFPASFCNHTKSNGPMSFHVPIPVWDPWIWPLDRGGINHVIGTGIAPTVRAASHNVTVRGAYVAQDHLHWLGFQ